MHTTRLKYEHMMRVIILLLNTEWLWYYIWRSIQEKVDNERRNLEYLIDLYLSRVAVEWLAFKSSQCALASSAKALKGKTRLFQSIRCRSSINYHSLHSLHDWVNPSTRRNNAIECDVTLELYCSCIVIYTYTHITYHFYTLD